MEGEGQRDTGGKAVKEHPAGEVPAGGPQNAVRGAAGSQLLAGRHGRLSDPGAGRGPRGPAIRPQAPGPTQGTGKYLLQLKCPCGLSRLTWRNDRDFQQFE
jgi:hypothetical protein